MRNPLFFAQSLHQAIKQPLMEIFCVVFYYFGLCEVIRFWRRFFCYQKKIVILGYHRVQDDGENFLDLKISLESFRDQIDYIRKKYEVIFLDEAASLIKRKQIKKDTVIITFDDGYRDNYVNAYPILKTYRIPATIFVTTGFIGTKDVLWHDRISHIIRNLRIGKLDEESCRKYPSSVSSILRSLIKNSNKTQAFCRQLVSALKRLPEHLKVEITEDISKASPNNSQLRNDNLMLSWDEIYVLDQNGISIGSHTRTHPILTNLSEQQCRGEIIQSKIELEQSKKLKVKLFSYPNGRENDFNQKIKHCVKEAGYVCACTTIKGTNNINSDLFSLKRWVVYDMPLHTFATKLSILFACE